MSVATRTGRAWVRTIAVTLAIVVVALALQTTLCPCERLPGGYLLGETVSAPVEDWSFANDVPLCQIEVRAVLPHSINLNCMAERGTLYLSCASCAGKRWSATAQEHPDARLRLADRVYPVRLTRVVDTQTLDVAWQARVRKLGVAPDTPRPDGWWAFRVESRR